MSPTAAITSDRDKIMLMNIDYCDPEGNDKSGKSYEITVSLNIKMKQLLKDQTRHCTRFYWLIECYDDSAHPTEKFAGMLSSIALFSPDIIVL